ncbi:MAG: SH3 domain-containing protein [Vicinamibacterales bacterium]
MTTAVTRCAAVCLCALLPVLAAAQDGQRVRVTRATTVTDQPSGDARVVATANPGDVLEQLDERDGWLLVRPPAGSPQAWRTGWVNAASTERIGAGMPAGATAPSTATPSEPGGRKGFVIGLGAGVGAHRYTTPTIRFGSFSVGGERVSSSGLATEFLLGYAPTDRLMIHYQNSLQLTGDDAYDLLGMTGGGATYFFGPRARSWYVTGALGAAIGADVNLDRGTVGSSDRGLAYVVGGGVEFARHWLLGGSAMFLKLNDITHGAYRATLTWVFY